MLKKIIGQKIAIGHSLSASFIVSSLLMDTTIFDAYIAISPNFAYDKERLASEFIKSDYQQIKSNIFLYLSNANEGVDGWQEWVPAREKVYSFLKREDKTLESNLKFIIEEFPNEDHWSTFAPAVRNGLIEYFKYEQELPVKFSEELYDVTITIKVPNEADEVYLTGNQAALGDWSVDKVRLNNKSKFEREINLKLHSPAELKFTRGSWDTEAVIQFNEGMKNIFLYNLSTQREYKFEVLEWVDK